MTTTATTTYSAILATKPRLGPIMPKQGRYAVNGESYVQIKAHHGRMLASATNGKAFVQLDLGEAYNGWDSVAYIPRSAWVDVLERGAANELRHIEIWPDGRWDINRGNSRVAGKESDIHFPCWDELFPLTLQPCGPVYFDPVLMVHAIQAMGAWGEVKLETQGPSSPMHLSVAGARHRAVVMPMTPSAK